MTDIKILDLNDPSVRAMADRNHVPEETWTVGGSLISVACGTCGYEWPCATRTALRSLEEREPTFTINPAPPGWMDKRDPSS